MSGVFPVHRNVVYGQTCILALLGLFIASSAQSEETAESVHAVSPEADQPEQNVVDALALAKQVTIYRDSYGQAHVFGETDQAALFGFGYVQAEDFFWQVEDSYILALGRYCEAHGPAASTPTC